MATECHSQLTLGFQSKIVVDFNGGRITSDSGLLLLRQFDEQLALIKSCGAYLRTSAMRGSSNTTLIKCSVRGSTRSRQAMRTVMTRTRCETIRPFRPSSVKAILWPLSPRSRGKLP